LLADLRLGREEGGRLDPSDIVQQTLLDTHRGRHEFRGWTEAETASWLRRPLACNLAEAVRPLGRANLDPGRDRLLETPLQAYSTQSEYRLAAEQSSPSERAERNEAAIHLVDALAGMPEANRQPLVM
jgi:RNA polymerase sigma-70 factor (ECF subfamily)